MKSLMMIFIILISFVCTSLAQPPDTLWTRDWRPPFHEEGFSVTQVDDGFMAAGYRVLSYNGTEAIWILKIDVYGDTMWTKTYDFDDQDRANCIRKTDDGGFILCGETDSFGAGQSDLFLMKVDENGDSLWFHVWGGEDWDVGHEVQQTTDGGFIVVGTADSYGFNQSKIYLIKTDADGDTLWTQKFGATGMGSIEGKSVQQTTDGGYILVGSAQFVGDDYEQVWLIKTDANGDVEWSADYGDGTSDTEEGESVRQTTDGGYIITGRKREMGYDSDLWLVKTNASGVIEWADIYGHEDHNDWGYCVRQTTDGGYVVAGEAGLDDPVRTDCWLLKTDENGDSLWSFTIGGTGVDVAYEVEETDDEGFIIVGKTNTFAYSGYVDFYLMRLGGELPFVESPNIPVLNQIILHPVFPNPANPVTTISFSLPHPQEASLAIYNTEGQVIAALAHEVQPASMQTYTWNASGMPSGVYLARLTGNNFTEIQKIVVMK
jgi:hypothetical protein